MPPTNETDSQNPGATGADDAAATNPTGSETVTPETAQLPAGYELIRTEDKKNLVSQRDKANNASSENDAALVGLLQKDAIRDALGSPEFKENYPDVTFEELLELDPANPEQIEELAKARQARYEKVIQDNLKKVQTASTPEITQADKDTQLKELAGPNKPKNAFQKALQLSFMKTK